MKLAWTSRSQYLFENNFFVFYIQLGQISVKRFFQMNNLAVLSEHTVQCPKTFFYILIYLHFSNFKFWIFCSMDWFRFQKPFAIDPFWIPRYQYFWDKSLGWFLGFQFSQIGSIREAIKNHRTCDHDYTSLDPPPFFDNCDYLRLFFFHSFRQITEYGGHNLFLTSKRWEQNLLEPTYAHDSCVF